MFMLNKKIVRFATLVFALAIFPVAIFSSDIVSEAESIINKTNDLYNKGNYKASVKSINRALDLYEENTVPDGLYLMAEAVYYAWLNDIYKNIVNNKYDDFHKAVIQISLHSEIISPRSFSLINKIYDSEEEYLKGMRKASLNSERDNSWNKINAKIKLLEENRNDLKKVISGEKTAFDVKLEIEKIESEKQKFIYSCIVITLHILVLLSIGIAIIVIITNRKKQAIALSNFKTMLDVVALIGNDSSRDETENAQMRGMSFKTTENKTLSFFSDTNARDEFIDIQRKCSSLGKQIDKVTFRQNNSRKVSELVYRMCMEDGINNDVALMYFCAAMVYDVGFLGVEKNILSAEHLTIKQRYEIRSHVQNSAKYFDFIPETIRKIFIDAAEFHHENIDGKGYLTGTHGSKIPLVARMIRVAESYESLVNPRIYRQILDSESAIKELKSKSGVYDVKIVSLLEKIV